MLLPTRCCCCRRIILLLGPISGLSNPASSQAHTMLRGFDQFDARTFCGSLVMIDSFAKSNPGLAVDRWGPMTPKIQC